MFGSLLAQGLPMAMKMMQANNASPMPGQESRPLPNLSGLMQFLGAAPERSGAVGLPQQQAQQQSGGVLPDREFGTEGVPPSLAAALGQNNQGMASPMDFGSGQDPLQWQKPGVQQQPVSQGAVDPVSGQPSGGQQKPDWGQLLSPFGTMTNPNALVRAGVGYNQGGLLGALGYLLTDMRRENNQY